MLGQIDKNRKPDKSRLFLCKPNRQVIAELSDAYNRELKTSYNGIHEFSFTIPYMVTRKNKSVVNPNFHLIRGDYLIKYVKGTVEEYFVIVKPSNSGSDKQDKTIQCYLLPYQLRKKLVRAYSDTKKLYDPVGTDSFLHDTLIKKTNWTVGYLDGDLLTKFRTVDVSEQSLIEFINTLCDAFSCIAIWDTKNKRVNFYKELNYGTDRGLIIEEGKYLKSISEEPDFDNVSTVLFVYGKDDLTFNSVNPTGLDSISMYNFYMYPFERDTNKNVLKSSDYMSDGLCHALLDYQILLQSKDGQFASLMTQMTNAQTDMITKGNELQTLQTEMNIIQDNIDTKQALGQDVADLLAQKAAKQAQINSKQSEIDTILNTINSIQSQINTLKSQVSLENNFTSDQIVELNDFVHEKIVNQQYISDEQELYDFAKEELVKLSQPLIHYEMDIVDFTQVVQCQRDWDKLNYGDIITVRYPKFNVDIKARIISIIQNEDNHSVKIEIANSNDINSGFLTLKDLYQKAATSSATIDMSKFKWDKSEQNTNSINSIINSDFDAVGKRIIAGVDETVEISRRGIRVSNPQFPEDLTVIQAGAIGLIKNGEYKVAMSPDRGIVADLIKGRLIAGINLVIENDSGKYVIDQNGLTISSDALSVSKGQNGISINTTDGLVITRSDDQVKSIFNATDGIKIQTKIGNNWKDSFFLDANTKEMTFDGIINAKDLKINGSSVLTTDQLKIKGGVIDKIKIEQLDATTAKIGKAMIEEGLFMSPDSVISWGQVGDKPFIPSSASDIGALPSNSSRLTYIDANGVYTGTVIAENLIGTYIKGKDWMSTNDTTPFNVYIGGTNNLSAQIFYDSLNMYKQGTRYFRVDPTGVYHNGNQLGTGTAKFG